MKMKNPALSVGFYFLQEKNMLAGIQYQTPLKLEAIAEGGFSYAEIPYEILANGTLPTYQKKSGENHILRVSGLICGLKGLTPAKLYDILETCRKYQGNYIVLSTMNCESGVLEDVVEECAMMLTDYGIPVFIENGHSGSDETGYMHNAYSDVSQLMQLADYCNRLCERPMIGICYNIGYGNLLAKNIRSQLYQCREYLCLVHANDNGGVRNDKQMPYTFTKGRGDLSTDWYHIVGELIRMDFQGWMIFDTTGLFGRCPEELQTQFIRLMHAIIEEWENQYAFAERVLNKPDKKLILFGAGQMLADYMSVFGDKYPPYFAVDNGQGRWGTELCGVQIKNPKEILTVPEEERNVVICCMYYDAIGTQLREMGVAYDEFQDRYFV